MKRVDERQTGPWGSIGWWERAGVLGAGVVLALLLRASLLSFPSGDFTRFTRSWFEAIGEMGAVGFLASDVTNYAPAYTYLMVVGYYLFSWLPSVVAIKLIGIPFDFLCAYYVGKLVEREYGRGARSMVAFVATLFVPTLVINGAMWGQADVLYTTGLLAFVFHATERRDVAAGVALGLAFCVKLQTVFLAPLVLLLLLAGRLRLRAVLCVPALYLLSVVPAWLAGRPLMDLLTVYWSQAGYYPRLTSNAAHVYQWFPAQLYELMLPAGLVWAAGVVGLATYALYRAQPRWTTERVVGVATLFVLMVPYCLPKMHERYFFPADVFAVALAFLRPRLAWLPVAVGLISFFSYTPFLLRTVVVPLPYLAIAMGVVIVALVYELGTAIADERRSGAA